MTWHQTWLIIRAGDTIKASAAARLVWSAMASWTKTDDPVFYGAQSTLVRQTGLSERTVRSAIQELAFLGHIERAGVRGGHRGRRGAIRWKLIIPAVDGMSDQMDNLDPANLADKHSDQTDKATRQDLPADRQDLPIRRPANSAYTSRSHSEGTSDDDSDSGAVTARRGPGGPASPAPSDTANVGPSALVLAAMHRFGLDEATARRMVDEALGELPKAKGKIRNLAAYVLAVIADRLASAAGSGSASTSTEHRQPPPAVRSGDGPGSAVSRPGRAALASWRRAGTVVELQDRGGPGLMVVVGTDRAALAGDILAALQGTGDCVAKRRGTASDGSALIGVEGCGQDRIRAAVDGVMWLIPA